MAEPVLPPPPRTRARERRNGDDTSMAATLLKARTDALTAQTLLTPKGALGRAIQIGALTPLVRLLRWWPRTWVGRVLGLSWCLAVFRDAYSGEIWRQRDEPYVPPPVKRSKK